MAADRVAACGLTALWRGRRLAIPGLWNRLLVGSIRLAPRGLVLRVVGWLQQQR
jgi:short-subunit dehydrogenase